MPCRGDLVKSAAVLSGLIALLAPGCARRDRGAPAVPVIELAILGTCPAPGPSAQADPIWQAADVEAGPDGRIYVADAKAGKIHVFDPTGKRLLSFGRRGQGPGEFDFPHAVAVTGGRIYVKERDSRILTFDPGGVYTGQFRLSRPVSGFCVGDGGALYACRLYPADPARRGDALSDPAILVFDGAGEVVDAFGAAVPLVKDLTMLNQARVALGDDGSAYVAYAYVPLVRKYSGSGRLLEETKLPYGFIDRYRRENERTYGTSSYYVISPDIKCDGGRIFVMCPDRSIVRFLEMGPDLGLRAIHRVDLAHLGRDVRSRRFAVTSTDGLTRFYLLDGGGLMDRVYVAGRR